MTREMQDPSMAVDHAKLTPLIDRHAELQDALERCMARWEELHELLAESENDA